MDEIDFTMNGEQHQLSRATVIKAMRNQIPGRIQTYAVDIEGVRFPVKQVLAQSLRVSVTSFVSTRAQDLLTKLAFKVVNVEDEAGARDPLTDADLRIIALESALNFHSRRAADVDSLLDTATRLRAWLTH